MPQLPCTRRNEDTNLGQRIPNGSGIRQLAEIPILGLSLSLVLLLSSDGGEALVQLANLRGDLSNVCAVMLHVSLSGANDHVEIQFDVFCREPASGVVRVKADGMVARVVGCESEATLTRSSGPHDGVVSSHFLWKQRVGSRMGSATRGSTTHVNINLDAELFPGPIALRVVIPFKSTIVTCSEQIGGNQFRTNI